MSTNVTSTTEIPAANFYVLATDSFMSGWGPARGRDNVLIVPCRTLADADAVADILHRRSEMRRVRITGDRPRLRATWYAQVKDMKDVLTWSTDAH